MKNYYIFLDIDGVLWDWSYIKQTTKQKQNKIIQDFNPKSIDALNYLIKNLQKQKYNVTLVISSTWRNNIHFTIKTLYENGLDFNGLNVDITNPDKNDIHRGKLIKEYLQDKSNYDYIVIDDEMFDYKEENLTSHLIKTNIYNNSLNKEHIEKYFKKDRTIC